MTGVGGGSLMTPLLTLLFGVTPSVAVGTDLAFASLTKSAGTITHRSRGTVHWHIVGRLCMGALPAALLATLALQHFGPLNPAIGQVIRYSIAVSVMLTVVAILFRAQDAGLGQRQPGRQLQGRSADRRHHRWPAPCSAPWSPCPRSAPARSARRCW